MRKRRKWKLQTRSIVVLKISSVLLKRKILCKHLRRAPIQHSTSKVCSPQPTTTIVCVWVHNVAACVFAPLGYISRGDSPQRAAWSKRRRRLTPHPHLTPGSSQPSVSGWNPFLTCFSSFCFMRLLLSSSMPLRSKETTSVSPSVEQMEAFIKLDQLGSKIWTALISSSLWITSAWSETRLFTFGSTWRGWADVAWLRRGERTVTADATTVATASRKESFVFGCWKNISSAALLRQNLTESAGFRHRLIIQQRLSLLASIPLSGPVRFRMNQEIQVRVSTPSWTIMATSIHLVVDRVHPEAHFFAFGFWYFVLLWRAHKNGVPLLLIFLTKILWKCKTWILGSSWTKQ